MLKMLGRFQVDPKIFKIFLRIVKNVEIADPY